MRVQEKFTHFDDLGFAVFLLAPISLLFLAAVTTEALIERLPQNGSAAAQAAHQPVLSAPRRAGQTPCAPAAQQTASANDLNRKSSHE